MYRVSLLIKVLYITEAANTNHTELKVIHKVCYKDSQYYMLHFIFELEGKKNQHPDPKKKNIFKECKLMKIVKDDKKTKIEEYFKN